MAFEEYDESHASSTLKDRRFKLSRACDRCRRRRIKCDEGHPCQACTTAKSSCTFEEPTKRHPQKSKRTSTLEDRMHQLETLIAAIPPAVFAAGAGGLIQTSAPNMTSGSVPTIAEITLSLPQSPSISFNSPIPPPSLAAFSLTNPSNHFATNEMSNHVSATATIAGYPLFSMAEPSHSSSSYLYFDDEGFTRWQGETSGLPLLDLLVERHAHRRPATGDSTAPHEDVPYTLQSDWFPDRTLKRPDFNPQTMWRIITSQIPPDLMDSLVKCYLSTSYYLMPFLHIPTFLADYGNPQKWGEPGFAAFIVSICCLASRHVEDPRVRTDPNDGVTAGTQYFTLHDRLRTLPFADRPTLYTIQADLIAAIYAVGLGKLTKAASLLSEAVAIATDAGLHRTSDCYDLFDAVEDEVRKRTFWCVYIWDKQVAAHFGRPCLMRYRDCDVGEPSMVDDEYITKDGIVAGLSPSNSSGAGVKGVGQESRMGAFVMTLRIYVVLESVLDVPPPPPSSTDLSDTFLARASSLLRPAIPHPGDLLHAEEALLSDLHSSLPPQWLPANLEAMGIEDIISITQAARIHTAEQFAKMLIYRFRFSSFVGDRVEGRLVGEEEREKEAMTSAYQCALDIVNSNVAIAKKGLMTYFGVHVIHQLTQAGRTLVAVLLNCNSPVLEHLIPHGIEAVRNCVGLLRRFSGRYVCGLRSGDLMEEFCRLTQIPLESAPRQESQERDRPAWIRPVRKKVPSTAQAPRGRSNSSTLSDTPSPQTVNSQSMTFDSFREPAIATGMDFEPTLASSATEPWDSLSLSTGSSDFDINQFFSSDIMGLNPLATHSSAGPDDVAYSQGTGFEI